MPLLPRPLLVLLLVLSVPACDEEKEEAVASAPAPAQKHEPMLTKELVPPAAKGLVLGVATQADLAAAFGEGEVVKDRSLGGTAVAEYCGQPGVMIEVGPKDDLVEGTAWFIGEGEPKLASLELVLKAKDTCAWLESHVGIHPAAKGEGRGGFMRRVYGPGEYTGGSADGTIPAGIECRKLDLAPGMRHHPSIGRGLLAVLGASKAVISSTHYTPGLHSFGR